MEGVLTKERVYGDGWRFFVDVGGTFTDCLGINPRGQACSHKLLSAASYRIKVHELRAADTLVLHTDTRWPEDFFAGYKVRLGGAEQPQAVVAGFAAARRELRLTEPWPGTPPRAGQTLTLESPESSVLAGIRFLLGVSVHARLGRLRLHLATTKGTNALLTRTGAGVVFLTTDGFVDLLAIGDQRRPHLFALAIKKFEPLAALSIAAKERLGANGQVLLPLDLADLKAKLEGALSQGLTSLAIAFLHAHKNNQHELAAAALARQLGFAEVSCSSLLAPVEKLLPRAETTVLDAYLTPVLKTYLDSISAALPQADIKVMSSAGALCPVNGFSGKDSVLSGPAGGVVGVGEVARVAKVTAAIGFDMGGTSTDVCRVAGELELRYSMELKSSEGRPSCRLTAPMLAIETVAAGGGSICFFDGHRLCVGPASAGAVPGPACYGQGGPLTITDCNLLLGRLYAASMPLPLDVLAARQRAQDITSAINQKDSRTWTMEQVAEGFLRVAAINMAQPIKTVSVAKGYALLDHALISFGGAGAQHACQLADELQIRRIVQHARASHLSAFGLAHARTQRFAVRDLGQLNISTAPCVLDQVFPAMMRELANAAPREADAPSRWEVTLRLDLRYEGQESVLALDLCGAAMAEAEVHTGGASFRWLAAVDALAMWFHQRHQERYGYALPARAVQAIAAHVTLSERAPEPIRASRPRLIEQVPIGRGLGKAGWDQERVWRWRQVEALSAFADSAYTPVTGLRQSYWLNGEWVRLPVYRRELLRRGAVIVGPALVAAAETTLVIGPGWTARLPTDDYLDLEKSVTSCSLEPVDPRRDPIRLSLFASRFAEIAEQMGVMLENTAISVNIKERLDFSCALFAEDGDLVVNAPHIPVHLGAMGDTVRAIIKQRQGRFRAGEVFISNDPAMGGSHLPDITVVMPVLRQDGTRPLFFTAARAHHAEIGGIMPGSMPPGARNLAEEGVLLSCLCISPDEEGAYARLSQAFAEAIYPTRDLSANISDLKAQIAACQLGLAKLRQLVEGQGEASVVAYMEHLRRVAHERLVASLMALGRGKRSFADAMDDGSVLAVTTEIVDTKLGPELHIDFTGTAGVHATNLNATKSVVKAAVFYVLRLLVGTDLPLNEGLMRPVRLTIPTPSLLDPGQTSADPRSRAAVGGGNVETSQRLVDVLLGALGLAAASQGTMNNLLFGRDASGEHPGFGYYETIGGGSGATPTAAGADAVQTHMTNTRITDPETLESRFPVLLRQFAIRPSSGGQGAYPGGNGLVREIEFLANLQLSLLTSRRTRSPFGLAGGGDGQRGINRLWSKERQQWQDLSWYTQRSVETGDVLRLETPGGGGYGKPF